MSYQDLQIIKYNNYSEYTRRFQSYGVLKTNIFPYLDSRGSFETSSFELFVVPIAELQSVQTLIQQNSKAIMHLTNELPKIALEQLFYELAFEELKSQNEIENVHTTRKELLDAVDTIQEKNKKVRLASVAAAYNAIYLENYYEINELQDIRNIYDVVTAGEIEKESNIESDSPFRKKAVFVGDQNKKHNPPTLLEEIEKSLNSWINFSKISDIPVLIQGVLLHFSFENIHPFYDGNGRTGRFLLSNFLAKKLDKFTALIVSNTINENKNSYYKLFESAENANNRAEGTNFVLKLLEFIQLGQMQLINRLEDKIIQLKKYSSKLDNDFSLSEIEKNILFVYVQSNLFGNPGSSSLSDNEIIKFLSKDNEFSKNNIKKTIDKLEKEKKILLIKERPKIHRLGAI